MKQSPAIASTAWSARWKRPLAPSTPRAACGFCLCIGGVPGVGKTALLRAHVTEREARDRQRTGSSILKEIIAPATVQGFDRWPSLRREAVREACILRLRAERQATPGRLLVDGHFTLRNRSSGAIETVFTPGDRSFYDALVLVEAPAEQIRRWRDGDTRLRPAETLAQIKDHLAEERAESAKLARSMRVALLIIDEIDLDHRLALLDNFLDAHAELEAP